VINFIKYIIVFFVGIFFGWFNHVIIKNLSEEKPFGKNWFHEKSSTIEFKCLTYSPKSLLLEIVTGVVFVILYSKYSITADFFFFAYLMIILIIMFFIDLKTKTIPNELVVAGLIGGLAVFTYNIFLPLSIYGSKKWWEPLLGLLPGSGVLFLIAILGMIIYKSDEVMGMGDVKIFAPIGIFLGWKMCLLTLVVSIFLGGFSSILLILFRIKKRKDVIPFGPFIAIAVFITILFGNNIWEWYFSWL